MISNVAPNYHWGVTKNQYVFVLNLFCKEYSFGQVQFLYLVLGLLTFCLQGEGRHTFFFMANVQVGEFDHWNTGNVGGLQLLWIKMHGFKTGKLGGGFKYFLFSPLLGDMIQFD